MKQFLLFATLAFSTLSFSQALYEEGFEGFAAGDYVSDSPVWITWTSGQEGSAGDAQISDEQAHTGSNSLNIYANSATGGPMDVVLLAGLDEGVYEGAWWMYVPDGNSAYYNVQEDQSPGVGWAFEATFAFTGDMQIVADGATVGSGTFPIATWFEVKHLLDLDNDMVTILIDGTEVGSFAFDSPFGGINFYGMGDGTTVGNYFVDDITLAIPTDIATPAAEVSFNFGPNPATNYINLKGQPNNATLRIHALNGQLVHQQIVNNMNKGQTIELNLDNGVYFLEVVAGNQRTTQRLVISQ
ncbi:MAG: T9SS type A sorting domain-containing protein [Bacteroidetes bacterium]|nr:T9SS type A sorting domain-containing protein [Bacteroidota bacterium]MDA1336847.1 T9SS type A sorting domain-containing protein [Bacteroidota bacterium]